MAGISFVLLSCLVYGIAAHPPASSYYTQHGAPLAPYRPALHGSAGQGSLQIAPNTYNGYAGRPFSSVGIGGINPISSGYQLGGAYQQPHQFPSRGSGIGQHIGVPVGIGGRHTTSGYYQGIGVPISSGYAQYSHPGKYAHAPYYKAL